MEIIYQVNFDYEYKLFHDGKCPAWSSQMNKALEFVALLWGDELTLANQEEYSKKYLDQLKSVGLGLVKLSPAPATHFFWGPERDLPLERQLNSKRTSFELAHGQGWLHPDERLVESGEKVVIPAGWVLKPIYSVSGRGFLFGERTVHSQGDAILAPWFERVMDISFIWREQRQIYLLNSNDRSGRFSGAIIMDQEELAQLIRHLFDLELQDLKELHSRVVTHYQGLGADSLQIDCFIYKHEKGYAFYPLCEVNYRKTFGELTWRLSEKLALGGEGMELRLGKHTLATTELRLSPEKAPWTLSVGPLTLKELYDRYQTKAHHKHQD